MPLTIAQTDQQVVSESLTTADWVVAAAVLVGSVIAAQIVKRLVARAVEGAGGDERIARAVGRWVAYAARSIYDSTVDGKLVKARHDLYAVRIADQKIVQLTATDDLDEVSPTWAPEGLRIAFARADTRVAGTVEPGEPDNVSLYVMPFEEPKD